MADLHKLTKAEVVIIRPTTDGNGFKSGQEYRAQRSRHMYLVRLKGDHIRWVHSVDTPSAHLWDGKDWDAAGHFEYIRDE